MITDTGAASLRVSSKTHAVREYAGTDLYDHLLGLLEALVDLHTAELASISPDDLRYKQGAIRQAQALHTAMSAKQPTIPTV